MIDASNRVLTNIKTYVAETCKNVSNYSSKAPPEFPAVSVVQIDNPDACMDLENNENAVTSVIEIQCYSNKSNTETRNIINQCCDAMRMMGYRRTYGPKPVTNASDTSIYRAVARFTRLVSAVDEIEKFGTKGAQSSLF